MTRPWKNTNNNLKNNIQGYRKRCTGFETAIT